MPGGDQKEGTNLALVKKMNTHIRNSELAGVSGEDQP